MADNSYNIMVSNPVTPFTMSRSFKACSNGKIFIGKPDTDPTVAENQIPVFFENEDGSTVQVSQPLVINSAGYPVYNGQVSKFVTTQNHSMAVYDSYMVQQFYWGDLSEYTANYFNSLLENYKKEIYEGDGEKVGTTGDKTLEEFSKNAPYYSGLDVPVHNDWKVGSASLYTTVWKWTDGSYWWGCNGNLPDSPSVYNMRRYNPFGDPVNIRNILANIFFQDRTANSTLWSQFISGVMKRIPIATNTTYMAGDGTIESALGIKPAMQLLGQLAWPDQSLSGATLIETLSSSEASGWGTFAGKWNLSTPSALGIGTDTGSCAVYTGHLASKKLFRLVIANSGRMYIKVMSGNFVWGSYYEVYSTLNTTKSSSGVLSAASPIVRVVDTVATTERTDLLEDTFSQAGDYGAANGEALGCTVTKEGVGVYRIKGCKSLASSGWQVRDPFPLQGSTALGFAEGVTQDDGSVLIYLYKRKLTLDSSSGEITESKGDAMDVPANSWVDVRLDMPEVAEDKDDTTNVVLTEGGVDSNG
ncbi:phage tailspike protein [Tatumella sp. OPLPL6]|uniref:phage tailspike protein n=1 Tax=Tatumella sp. OPLPL6 TaxID=1928657 RepID=UPI000C1A586A|nr:phage tailspike protein [Tatumella sp. OPLPL6]PIJ46086.1 hypothetical protein BOM24_01620 [Tatumella sp. OPLPL6]